MATSYNRWLLLLLSGFHSPDAVREGHEGVGVHVAAPRQTRLHLYPVALPKRADNLIDRITDGSTGHAYCIKADRNEKRKCRSGGGDPLSCHRGGISRVRLRSGFNSTNPTIKETKNRSSNTASKQLFVLCRLSNQPTQQTVPTFTLQILSGGSKHHTRISYIRRAPLTLSPGMFWCVN